MLDLFLYTYKNFRDKFYEPLLEHILNAIMNNEYLKDKEIDKNIFMIKILNSMELLNPFKIIRTTENILEIFINYIKNHLNDPNFNKKDPRIIHQKTIY